MIKKTCEFISRYKATFSILTLFALLVVFLISLNYSAQSRFYYTDVELNAAFNDSDLKRKLKSLEVESVNIMVSRVEESSSIVNLYGKFGKKRKTFRVGDFIEFIDPYIMTHSGDVLLRSIKIDDILTGDYSITVKFSGHLDTSISKALLRKDLAMAISMYLNVAIQAIELSTDEGDELKDIFVVNTPVTSITAN